MIPTGIRRAYLLSAFFLILSSVCFAQDKSLSPYPGIIHIHSNISQEGVYPFRKLVTLAQTKGIKILVFTDTFLNRWEYGLPVLPNIFKASVEKRCIVKYGIRNYLKDLEKIRDEFPDTIILSGAEVAPFYWYSGSIFKGDLSLNDWSRHLLVIGLKSYQDYAPLPVAGNRYFKPQLKDAFSLLIPVALIILGVFLLKKSKTGHKILGWTLNILGVLFLFNAFPFSASRFDPYHGQRGFFPYQDLINYANKKSGLVFWAHPMIDEDASSMKFLNINLYTPAYPEALAETTGYTGFGAGIPCSASDNPILAAGGVWDNALKDYCLGKRNQPAWAIGEAEYTSGSGIDSVQNIFFLPEFSQGAVLEALRKGRFYLRYYSTDNIDISLTDFRIENGQGLDKKTAFIGEEVEIKDKPKLYIKGSYKINPLEDLSIEVIRNGEIIQKLRFGNGGIFDSEFQDNSLPASPGKNYYRLNFFAGGRIILVTNPIFINIKNE